MAGKFKGIPMNLQLIRSATLRLEYAGRRILIDPYLAAKFSRPSFTGKSPNPMIDLPFSPQEVISNIDAIIVSHLHSDHFDPAAQELLPKDTPILCQPMDEVPITSMGFHHVTPVVDSLVWHGITITRTPCQHGSGDVLDDMGTASGFVFQTENEPTVYWVGDTIYYEAVAEVITHFQPQVIITHSCGAVWGDHVLIVMDAAQTIDVCKSAPKSFVVATHMEALDHATITRAELREYATLQGISLQQLLIPEDGETLLF
jgi:L-ascorbate metabolism protein UlaG (beta-lactamase superfamily)